MRHLCCDRKDERRVESSKLSKDVMIPVFFLFHCTIKKQKFEPEFGVNNLYQFRIELIIILTNSKAVDLLTIFVMLRFILEFSLANFFSFYFQGESETAERASSFYC